MAIRPEPSPPRRPFAAPVPAKPARRREWLGHGLFLALLVPAAAVFAGLPWPWTIGALAQADPAETAFQAARRAEARAAGAPEAFRHARVPLGQVAPDLVSLVLLAEDLRFFEHGGVDWAGLHAAFRLNWREGRVVYGASTLTMQLAKNLWLSESRGPLEKARQIVGAGLLEHHLPKERILELYLNEIEWGPGVFGAEAASRHWFGKPAARLTRTEAARLAAIIPAPRRLQPRVVSLPVARRADALVNRLADLEGRARSQAR